MAHNLTDKQKAFIDIYFDLLDEPFPNNHKRMEEAKRRAGYAEGSKVHTILQGVSKEVIEKSFEWAALHLPQALHGVINVIDNPTMPGAKNLIAAAATIMDRGGLAKSEKLNIETESSNAILILPAKEPIKLKEDE